MVYDMLYDFIGFPEGELSCPELYSLLVSCMSVMLVVAVIYLIFWFLLSVFRSTKRW